MLYSVLYTPPQGSVIYGIFYSPSPSSCTEYHADIRPVSNRFLGSLFTFPASFLFSCLFDVCVYAVVVLSRLERTLLDNPP
jgi:hypothetical protein